MRHRPSVQLVTRVVASAMLGIVFLAFIAPAAFAAESAGTPGPRELIDSVAQRLLKELQGRREELRNNPEELRKVLDTILLPHFDTQTAAQRVLATHWRTATPAQRQRFIDAFYKFMLQTYGNALVEFTPEQLVILPFRGDAAADTATVQTLVHTGNGKPVPVNYSLRRTPSGWKAWDVTIEGISYVVSFRNDIGAEVNQKGLDAVIARLESGTPPAKPPGSR